MVQRKWMRKDYEKCKLKYIVTGKSCLPDRIDDLSLILLAEGVPQDQIPIKLPAMTDLAVKALLESPEGQARFEYLKRREAEKQAKSIKPTSNDEYMAYALSRLHALSEKAEADKDKVSASHKLGVLAHLFKKGGNDTGQADASALKPFEDDEGAE